MRATARQPLWRTQQQAAMRTLRAGLSGDSPRQDPWDAIEVEAQVVGGKR